MMILEISLRTLGEISFADLCFLKKLFLASFLCGAKGLICVIRGVV